MFPSFTLGPFFCLRVYIFKTLKVFKQMIRLLLTVAQLKRCFTSCFVSLKTAFTTESEITKATSQTTNTQATTQTTKTQATATKESSKFTLCFQTVFV